MQSAAAFRTDAVSFADCFIAYKGTADISDGTAVVNGAAERSACHCPIADNISRNVAYGSVIRVEMAPPLPVLVVLLTKSALMSPAKEFCWLE